MLSQTISGIKSGSFRSISHVLHKWIQIQDELVNVLRPDNVPWWYNERASIGSLAAAVWSSGGIAFEEYVTTKYGKTSKILGSGRGDIFFRVGRSDFRGEAKQIWGKLRGSNQPSVIERNLKVALKEAKRRPIDTEHQIGILFLSPNIPEAYKKEIDDHIESWIKMLKAITHVACAWTFPSSTRNFTSEEDNKIYPGAAIIIKS